MRANYHTTSAIAIIFLITSIALFCVGSLGVSASYSTPTPTSTLTHKQEYYATRNWAWDGPTPTPTPWPRIMPCHPDWIGQYEHMWDLEMKTIRWARLIYKYSNPPYDYHDVPLEIALAVMMHESRGNPNAVSCKGAIGLFQVLSNDTKVELPDGCDQHKTWEGNPPSSELLQFTKNIQYGLDHLEDYTHEAVAYARGLKAPPYRPKLGIIYEGAEELSWWYKSVGRITLAMYQCGPKGFRDNICGRDGGLVYAEDVLGCWLPWVQDVLSQGPLEPVLQMVKVRPQRYSHRRR